ncbi:MAG: FAD-dependent oxidoreductase, partial [Victivallaceae bacterium]|nr:FAD-dependent oxidoreductase [Victivallaceae bacterium]
MKVEEKIIKKDFIVVGSGLPGMTAAIQAARLGLSVALINNRGYIGGNASVEVGVAINGARSQPGFNQNSREGGIIEEIKLENMYKNPTNSRHVRDAVFMDFIYREKNIELYANTSIDEVDVDKANIIISVSGSQSTSETRFRFFGNYFLDDTGDGTLGYLSGAEYMSGREAKKTFNERIAPDKADDYVLLSTLCFRGKDTGKPVKYIAPDFALDIEKSGCLKHRRITAVKPYKWDWHYELGAELDQMKDTEEIIRQHRSLVYGIWDYIKNSGKYPESENCDLELVSSIAGKRESRRIIGDYVLTEGDVLNQTDFADTIAHGGWSIDLHSVKGFWGTDLINRHIVLKGVYQIPYRCCYSKNINNLFLGGRCFSTSHVAFGTTRVMSTLAAVGQAVGAAAFLCARDKVMPASVNEKKMKELKQLLLNFDQYIINEQNRNVTDFAEKIVETTASSYQRVELITPDGEITLNQELGFSLAVNDQMDEISFLIKAKEDTTFDCNVYAPRKKEDYYPQTLITKTSVKVLQSDCWQWVKIPVNIKNNCRYMFFELLKNEFITVALSDKTLSTLALYEKKNSDRDQLVDVDTLTKAEYEWRELPEQPCFKTSPENRLYDVENIVSGYARPHGLPNLWLSDFNDPAPFVQLEFGKPERIKSMCVTFDAGLNTRLLMGLLDFETMPLIAKDYNIEINTSGKWKTIKRIRGN